MSLTEYTSVEIANRTLTFYYDPDPRCPREWDNFGTIAAFHRNYSLGDIQELRDVIDELDQSKWSDAKSDDFYYSDDLGKVVKEMEKQGFIILPVYMYDHSGITLSTSPFSCQWDSGLLGIIYVSRKKVEEVFGWKRITKDRRKEIEGYLENEIKTYDQYVTGEVFGFVIEEDGNEVDSCWGFYNLADMEDHISSEQQDLFEELKKKENL